MLLRFDPFREFDRMTDEFDRRTAPTARPLPMDAVRRGHHVVVHIDVPGIAPEDVDVTVERDVLTVTAHRRPELAEDDERLVSERRHGEFTRQLLLGENLDADKVDAQVANGVLTIRVPIAETAKPRKVEVGTGGGGQTTLTP